MWQREKNEGKKKERMIKTEKITGRKEKAESIIREKNSTWHHTCYKYKSLIINIVAVIANKIGLATSVGSSEDLELRLSVYICTVILKCPFRGKSLLMPKIIVNTKCVLVNNSDIRYH